MPDDKRKHVAATEGGTEGRVRSHAGDRPRPRGRVDQLASAPGAEAEGARQADRLPRDHQEAIEQALEDAHDVDENLVRAQESRRILDRLYGYTLSPVLWKKVQTGLSAGRVQSVAVRMHRRSRGRAAGVPRRGYWDLDAQFSAEGREFPATLARLGDQRVATGKDFDAQTASDAHATSRLLSEADAARARRTRFGRICRGPSRRVEAKPGVERPAPPFTTSTLTQEASRKLGVLDRADDAGGAAAVPGRGHGNGEMEGLITYHRTDSTTLSATRRCTESARAIREMFGDEYYDGPRRYATKVKNAQEAHEAIRPTNFRLAPPQLEGVLDPRRPAALRADLEAHDGVADGRRAGPAHGDRDLGGAGANGEPAVFTASGKAIEFAGFRRAYVEGSDDPAAELEEQESDPAEARRWATACTWTARRASRSLGTEPKRHETTPPARYTEASLIKELERLGIGRPSTYAPTIGTIVRRGYVFRQGKALVPSFTAFAVTRLLREHFGDFVDVGVHRGDGGGPRRDLARRARVGSTSSREFYLGDGKHRGLRQAVERGAEKADYPADRHRHRSRIGRADSRADRTLRPVSAGGGRRARAHSVAARRRGAGRSRASRRRSTLVRAKAEGPRTLGVDPETGRTCT